jgi:zinc protease
MWIDGRQAVPPPLTPPVKAASPGEKLLVLPGKSQCDLFISFPGAMPSNRDYHPLLVANSILGQFGLMGRLGDVVRDKMGLAYYAASQLSPRLHGGEINIYAGVNPKNARKAIEVIKKEVERFRSKMVDEKELSDSKGNILGGLPLGLETGAAICRQLLSIAMHQLPLDYFQRYYQDVHNITRERVLEIANRYLSTEPVIAVAGPEIPKA